MKLAAALILTLASSVVLADPQPRYGFIGDASDGNDWFRQPISRFQGDSADRDVDGADFSLWQRSSGTPAENGYDVHTYSFDGKGNDVITEEISL